MKSIVVVVMFCLSILAVGCGKPSIEYDCTMNGMGSGSCVFTNTGKGIGSVCGSITVCKSENQKTITSVIFCSGEIPPRTTNKIEFSVIGMAELCSSTDKAWSDVCYFSFESDDPGLNLEKQLKEMTKANKQQ